MAIFTYGGEMHAANRPDLFTLHRHIFYAIFPSTGPKTTQKRDSRKTRWHMAIYAQGGETQTAKGADSRRLEAKWRHAHTGARRTLQTAQRAYCARSYLAFRTFFDLEGGRMCTHRQQEGFKDVREYTSARGGATILQTEERISRHAHVRRGIVKLGVIPTECFFCKKHYW